MSFHRNFLLLAKQLVRVATVESKTQRGKKRIIPRWQFHRLNWNATSGNLGDWGKYEESNFARNRYAMIQTSFVLLFRFISFRRFHDYRFSLFIRKKNMHALEGKTWNIYSEKDLASSISMLFSGERKSNFWSWKMWKKRSLTRSFASLDLANEIEADRGTARDREQGVGWGCRSIGKFGRIIEFNWCSCRAQCLGEFQEVTRLYQLQLQSML